MSSLRVSFFGLAAFVLLGWSPVPVRVGGEIPLDDPPRSETFSNPTSIATDGEGAFVTAILRGSRDWDGCYFGGVLDADGHSISESTRIGCTDFVTSSRAAVASNGSEYMVVYGAIGTSVKKTYAVRYSNTGVRGAMTELPTDAVADIAWDGTSYVVLTGSKALRLNATGAVLDANIPLAGQAIASRNGVTVAVSTSGPVTARTLNGGSVSQPISISPNSTWTDIAEGDPGFLVVYESGGGVLGRLLDPSGNPDGPSFFISNGAFPSAAWNGNEWTVAFRTSTTDEQLRAVRVMRGPVAQPFAVGGGGSALLAANGTTVYAALNAAYNPIATIEGEQVTVRGPAPLASASQGSAQMATVANASLVVWNDGATRARRMAGGATSNLVERPGAPAALASRGNEALLVLNGEKELHFVVLDAYGRTRTATTLTRPYWVQYVEATWTGDHYLVAWNEWIGGEGLYIAEVSVDGVVETPKLIAPRDRSSSGLAIATSGETTLVLWGISGSHTNGYLIEDGDVVRTKVLTEWMLHAAADDEGNFLVARRLLGEVGWQGLKSDGSLTGSGQMPIDEAIRHLNVGWTGKHFVLNAVRGGDEEQTPAGIEITAFHVTRDGALIDEANRRAKKVFTMFPANVVVSSLRNGETLDMVYYRSLTEDGLNYLNRRLVYRTIDAPRRRSMR